MVPLAAHIATMLAMIIACSLMMAGAMAVVGWGRRRDGLRRWAAALLINAIGHLLLMLRGYAPDWLSIVIGNVLLSCVFVGITAAVCQFQGRAVRWHLVLVPPLVIAALSFYFIGDFGARVGALGLVIGLQSMWAMVIALQRRDDTVGRGLWLLVATLAVEAVVLIGRAALALATGGDVDVLRSNLVQALTLMATFSVVLLGSMGFVFMSRDRADESNRLLAARDPLTGAANRRALIAALDRDVARAIRTREPIALMMVDIDHFKAVNDRYGHPAGDQVLCSVVDVLRSRVRSQDLVGRYGGEEFMVLLPDTTLAGAVELARQLCLAVEASRCRCEGLEIAVTVSIGVFGGVLNKSDSWDMLIAAADRALYAAKKNGRNRVEVSSGLRRPSALAAAQVDPETYPTSSY